MENNPSFLIRPLTPSDKPFLRECLWLAIYLPQGTPPLSPDILKDPELAKYLTGWGIPSDYGFLALDPKTSQNLGALWLRQFTEESAGYGYVSDQIPELSMAVVPEYRNQGIGSALLERLFSEEKYDSISLSVSPQNPALRLYERFGFKRVGTKGDSFTMLWNQGST